MFEFVVMHVLCVGWQRLVVVGVCLRLRVWISLRWFGGVVFGCVCGVYGYVVCGSGFCLFACVGCVLV